MTCCDGGLEGRSVRGGKEATRTLISVSEGIRRGSTT